SQLASLRGRSEDSRTRQSCCGWSQGHCSQTTCKRAADRRLVLLLRAEELSRCLCHQRRLLRAYRQLTISVPKAKRPSDRTLGRTRCRYLSPIRIPCSDGARINSTASLPHRCV